MPFYMPVKIYSGKDCVLKNAPVFAEFGKKALIVTGRTSAKVCGALNDVVSVLEANNIDYDVFDKVLNNPSVENCFEGGKFAKEAGADFIVAIGGGSPLDAAKAIATYATNDIEPMEIFSANQQNKPLPFIAIPTTAGTGSEVTQYSVLTVDSEQTKRSFQTPHTFAKVAFLDAKYTMSLEKHITIDTAVDALSHALESILNKRSTLFSELYAKESLKLIAKAIPSLVSGELDYNARKTLLTASMYAGVAIAQTGTCIVHSMGYALTYYKGLSHGRANGMLLGSFFEYCESAAPELCKELLGYLNLKDAKEFTALLSTLMPDKNIISENEAKAFSQKSIKAKNIVNCLWDVTQNDEYLIYKKLI